MSASEDPPEIKDHKGSWDEKIAGFIVAAPSLLLLLGAIVLAWALWTGRVTVSGTIPAGTLLLAGLVFVGVPWALSVAKFFGIKPVVWLANWADSYSRE